jgi:uncharacterized membrane protein YeaQ/YmgE (transglycosylase-associated protein family)
MGIVPFFIFLIIGSVMAFLDEWFLPSSVPGGVPTAIVIGFLGAWVGSAMLWHVGPDLAGVPLLASAVCSALAIFFFSLISGGHAHTWD